MSTEAMKLALEALGLYARTLAPTETQKKGMEAITALDEALALALAQPQQEPVAIVDDSGVIVVCSYHYKPGDKLYTSPPARKPLTDEELEEIVKRGAENKPFHHWFARAIEAAHGIKGDA